MKMEYFGTFQYVQKAETTRSRLQMSASKNSVLSWLDFTHEAKAEVAAAIDWVAAVAKRRA
jgi:hypothetical protein